MKFQGRTQISNPAQGRMIQIQPTRFHLNWSRGSGAYPGYQTMVDEFISRFSAFRRFAEKADLGSINPNQWELTYINSIPNGSLWQGPSDWHKVLPGLFSSLGHVRGIHLESFGGAWQFEINPQRGRLHVIANLATLDANTPPTLLFQSIARGPTSENSSLEECLAIGNQAAVDMFLGVTSAEAQQVWGRTP
jgi:uncharacterized protein (TIGR04255 family)